MVMIRIDCLSRSTHQNHLMMMTTMSKEGVYLYPAGAGEKDGNQSESRCSHAFQGHPCGARRGFRTASLEQ